MNSQSNNPFYLVGTYIGIATGLFLYMKDWHPFWWLPSLIGARFDNLLILDMVGGAIAGYIFHILFRIFKWGGGKKN